MPSNTSGVMSYSSAVRGVAGQTLTAAMVNGAQDDTANELTARLMRDGRAPMTGALQGFAGTQSAPGYTFAGATAVGMFWDSATSTLGFSVGGTARLLVNASGISKGIPDGDKGDITTSANGATWTIDDKAVTLAKVQDLTAKRLLGRAANSTGVTEQISLGSNLTLSDAGVLDAVVPVKDIYRRLQAVNYGPVSGSTGAAAFLPGTSGTLSISTQNVTADVPFVVTAKRGALQRIGSSTANLTWTGLTSSSTCFLWVDVAADGTLTTGHTTTAPVYWLAGTPSVSNGAHTFNIGEGIMRAGDGANANAVWRVFVGEVVTSGSGVTSSVSYAYNGRYVSTDTTIPSSGTRQGFNHNIGMIPLQFEVWLKNMTSQHGYTPGMLVRAFYNNADINMPIGVAEDRLTMAGFWSNVIPVPNRSSAGYSGITNTSWNWVAIADRGWD